MVEIVATTNTFTESDFSSKEDGVMTQKQYELLQFVTDDVLQPTIGLLGIAGNILSLVVFSQPQVKMASSIRVYLRALCVIDLVFLIFSLYESMLEFLTPVSPSTISMLQAYGRTYEEPFRRGARGASSCMVVVIAFERFYAISYPMSANKSCFKRHPYLPIALVLFFNVIFGVLLAESFEPRELLDGSWVSVTTALANTGFLRVYGLIAEVSYLQLNSLKFLGIVIDDKLSWSEHIKYIRGKISRSIGMLSCARKNLDRKTLIQLYYAFIYPYLSYCIDVWGHCSQQLFFSVFKTQKRALRIISFSKRLAHTEPLFKSFEILPLQAIYILALSKFISSNLYI
ncbi:hypothetical protein CAPTEDRAFT_201987 [Capitella teleta]|uniref:G-protein coupled receptors family 1 profile domain-containing protein n=1 Tax=Capitella teleta TaxID=283909 RepID=R7T939_CAPTE|nr:hypothetical protein CAPTEDRAFT_201987 [Capitella teleta]|eukprot:ELT87915.1 hypothetical protein CAPTEDRAFT_201987 [Capitella teleta]